MSTTAQSFRNNLNGPNAHFLVQSVVFCMQAEAAQHLWLTANDVWWAI